MNPVPDFARPYTVHVRKVFLFFDSCEILLDGIPINVRVDDPTLAQEIATALNGAYNYGRLQTQKGYDFSNLIQPPSDETL